ncbi:MAG TPA: tRNA pseudouridine(38-40) synthase TruA [Blastocatellia bacterium]|nr:tRNA pseudouridine(38-40) synthase TruA [Blastocatellia bacterium]
MQNFKTTIQYDGTNYHGWQIQPNGRTVQGELTTALSILDHRPVTVYGAGRTDAGVHAEGQTANFFLERNFEPTVLRDAINGNLDRDIRVKEVVPVSDSFNARYAATKKTYRYRIWTGDVVSPFVYRYVHHYRGGLEIEEMQRGGASLIGEHDFAAFTVASSDAEDHVRKLIDLDIGREANEISIVVAADGFLRYMVRTIVGTLIEVGRGRRTAASVAAILESRDRANAGPSAPANGLTLLRVDY